MLCLHVYVYMYLSNSLTPPPPPPPPERYYIVDNDKFTHTSRSLPLTEAGMRGGVNFRWLFDGSTNNVSYWQEREGEREREKEREREGEREEEGKRKREGEKGRDREGR